jgi:2'-5' RNA ligase
VLERVYLKSKMAFENDPITMSIEGLGHFRNSVNIVQYSCNNNFFAVQITNEFISLSAFLLQVIFAKIKESSHISRLEELSRIIREEFESEEISGDTKVFQPHMTIAKMSRSKRLHKLVRSQLQLWRCLALKIRSFISYSCDSY